MLNLYRILSEIIKNISSNVTDVSDRLIRTFASTTYDGTKFDRKLEVNTDKLQSDEATDAENQEDDDDFEKLIIEEFDLAPVKFTKSVNGTEQKDRAPIEARAKGVKFSVNRRYKKSRQGVKPLPAFIKNRPLFFVDFYVCI